ncbi:MAG: amidohydrolase [Saprospiraceae bacterium]|nr:amidohydrolase [Saprospiraceae bacterium]
MDEEISKESYEYQINGSIRKIHKVKDLMKSILFGILILTVLCCHGQQSVYYNARIFTGDRLKPYAEAIAINGKWILAVGNYEDVIKKVNPSAERINMNGGFIMPGIIDTHNHGISGGKSLVKANTNDESWDVAQLVTYAKKCLENSEGLTGDVLVIYGINITLWDHLYEIMDLLNKGVFESQPIVLRGSDGHTSWSNNAMLHKSGVTKEYIASLKSPERQYFGTGNNGEPNGFISESGYQKIKSALVVETQFGQAAEKAMEYNNQFGITAWLDPSVNSFNGSYVNNLDWYRYLINKGKLTAHIAGTVVADPNGDPQAQISKLKALQKEYNAPDFSIIGFKVFADGVVEHPTHTAALSLPYSGTTSYGDLLIDPEKFADFAIQADKASLLVHVHAIGDRAVTETLNGFEAVRKANKNKTIPHTITHLQIVKLSDFTRFVRLNVLTSFQLLWALGDPTTIDIVKPYIDPTLFRWQYPVRSMLQAGATITGASDWPVTTANPFKAIYRAETRKGPLGVLDSTQCMPRMEMLFAYTSEAAKALRLEKKIGSLQAGKMADMILLDRDVLTVIPEEMRDTKVIWTMFEGNKVYDTGK